MQRTKTNSKPKATTRRTHYIVANHTQGPILIPRQFKDVKAVVSRAKPFEIPAGKAVPVDAEEWVVWRANQGVQNYLDAGLLSEVQKEGEVPVFTARTSNPVIPEHLKTEKESAETTGVSAQVTRNTPKVITI